MPDVRATGPDLELTTSPTLRALVAVEHPLPADLLSGLHPSGASEEDLPALLSRLEIDGLLEWNDDGTVEASDEAVARISLTGSERARLRGLVGRAAWSSSVPVELSAEWLLDGCRLAPDPEVVPWLLDRGDRLLRAGDLDRAAAVLTSVVAAAERGLPVDGLDRVRAYIRLGFVLRWLGRVDEANDLSARALGQARESGDPTALAIAALTWRPDSISVSDDPSAVALIDEALAAIDAEDIAMRSRLLSARADAVLFTDLSAAATAARDALDLGRRCRDPETFLSAAYSYRLAHWHPSRQEEMLRLGTEMVSVSTRAVDFAEYGPLTRLQVHLERGDWPRLDGELAAMGRRLRQAPRPFETLWWQVVAAARAQTRGDWSEAERLINSSLTIASGPEYGSAFQLLLTQQLITAWNRGEDLLPLVGADVLPAGPMRTSWEAGLLGWTCDRRDRAELTAELDRLLADGMASVRQDLTFGPVTSSLAMAAAEARSERHAATLFEGLAAFADQWAGTSGAVVNGPYALHLGRLAAVLGRLEEANRLLDQAARSASAGECTAWLARIHVAQAELADDPRRRRAYARQAATEANSLGMQAIAARAQAYLGTSGQPAGLTEREAEVLRLLAAGCTNAEMAERLYLSVKTVERHLLNAYRKARVRNRAEAAAFALRELAD